jgi:hypothetical protein
MEEVKGCGFGSRQFLRKHIFRSLAPQLLTYDFKIMGFWDNHL